MIERPSMCQPGAADASSVPKRNRSVIVCPIRFGPRLITESMYPPELPLHAIRPASGFDASLLISPVYPPLVMVLPCIGSQLHTRL